MTCPSDDILVQMVEGTLPPIQLGSIETHVDRCGECARMIAELGALAAPQRVRQDYVGLVEIDVEHYSVGEEIARGGMGRIVRARDRRLGRQLAIKETLVGSPEQTRRFEREARITARLQHPSIVHVHEAGRWPSGEPFFAMELIAGRSFDQVIGKAETLDQRLGLVPNALAIADAMAYAHDRGIIHRDLKPKNVLVGEYGETVVIDWGLAKDLAAGDVDEASDDDHPTETRAGTVIGTPSYMPPEQARGEAVDRRGDVYALGAVLFHVLAGHAPIAGASDDVIARIAERPLPSLAATQPGVPTDLLAIVTKAMAFDPVDRYPSARELADDLRQFQRGQLVGAHHYSRGELVRRWIARHRAAVTVAAAAFAILATIGIVSARRVLAAQANAEAERAVAERQRANAEDLMVFMLGDLREKLQKIGKVDLLATVANKAVDYYAQPTGEMTAHDRYARAVALGNLANVQLAQGKATAAVDSDRAALALVEQLARESPTDLKLRRGLASRHSLLGDALVAANNTTAAMTEYRADLEITQQLAAIDPNNTQWQRDLSVSNEKLGDILDTDGHFADAIAAYRRSVAITEKLAAKNPHAETDLAIGHQRLGETFARHDDLDAAATEHRVALAIRERIAARTPDDASVRMQLAYSHGELGTTLSALGDQAAATRELRTTVAIIAMLANRDPANAEWQFALADMRLQLGNVLRKADDPGALVELRAALATVEALAATDPSRAEWQHESAVTYFAIGSVHRARDGASADAAQAFRSGITFATAASNQDPRNLSWQRDLATSHEKLALVLAAQKDRAGALAEHRLVLAVRERLAAKDPSHVGWQNDLGVSHFNIGELLEPDDVPAALAEFRLSLAVSEAVAKREPDHLGWRADIVETRRKIAKLELARGNTTIARDELTAALAELDHLARVDAKYAADAAAIRRQLR